MCSSTLRLVRPFNVFINNNDVNVRGYFVWPTFDTFEFHSGYSTPMGLYHVDLNDSLNVPKVNAEWYGNFLTSNYRQ